MSINEQDTAVTLGPERVSTAERLLGASGLVLFLCIIAAGFFSPDPPSHGSPENAYLVFYQQHSSGVLTGAFLWDIAMMALILFAVALSRACRETLLPSTKLRKPLMAADLLSPFAAATAGAL